MPFLLHLSSIQSKSQLCPVCLPLWKESGPQPTAEQVGHKGRFGHEFLEFEINNDGKLRYANDSKYKNDVMIRKELYVGRPVVEQFRKIVEESEILKEDDNNWPQPSMDGTQELEIIMGDIHVSFCLSKINSLMDVKEASDSNGLRVLYYVVQDLKCLAFALINMHFKIKPIPI